MAELFAAHRADELARSEVVLLWTNVNDESQSMRAVKPLDETIPSHARSVMSRAWGCGGAHGAEWSASSASSAAPWVM